MTDPDLSQIQYLCTRPGVAGLDLYDDGVEVCGSMDDSDDSVAFIKGSFTPTQLTTVVATPITDLRGTTREEVTGLQS